MEFILKTGLIFGASRISNSTKSLRVMDDEEIMEIVPVARKQYELQISEIMKTIKRRIKDAAIKARERLDWEADRAAEADVSKVEVQKVNPINVPNTIKAAGGKAGTNMINIASSLQMSRMSQYGFLIEARTRGLVKYEVSEQLDNRTCPVCRRMDGRVFEIGPALAKVDTQIRITDPADLKFLAPFPRQDQESLKELDRYSPEELQQKGFNTPPYHPMCRGLLKMAKSEPNLQSVNTTSVVEGFKPSPPIQPRVADVLESPAAASLSDAQRSTIIAASAGVAEFADLPEDIQRIIEELDVA